MTDGERRAPLFLAKIGLVVEAVPTGRDRSCDFRARDANCSYLVEVKTRTEQPFPIDDPVPSEIYEFCRPAGRDANTTQAILHDAATQVDASLRSEDAFGLIWITIPRGSHNEEVQKKRVIDTFFGFELFGPLTRGKFKSCFFFGESVCFREKHVAALILDATRQFTLCINPFYTAADAFRDTSMFRSFDGIRPLIDAHQCERDGTAFVADCDIPRRDIEGMRAYIRSKYGLGPYTVNLVLDEHSSWVRIPGDLDAPLE